MKKVNSIWTTLYTYFFSYFSHRCNGRSVKIVIILSGLYKQMILYISLHLFPRGHKVIISSVHFIFSSTPCCICRQKDRYKSVGIILCISDKQKSYLSFIYRTTHVVHNCRIYQGTRRWDRRWCDPWAVRERSRDACTVSWAAARLHMKARSLRCL